MPEVRQISSTCESRCSRYHQAYTQCCHITLFCVYGQILLKLESGHMNMRIGMEGIADCFYDQKVCSSIVKKS